MNDPYSFADILLGRIDAVRSNVDCLVHEFGRRAPSDATTAKASPKSSDKDSLYKSLRNRIDRAQQNLKILDTIGSRFEAQTNALGDIGLAERNLLLEFQWKRGVQERGMKANRVFREQLGYRFNRLPLLNDDLCPSAVPLYYFPKPSAAPRNQSTDAIDRYPTTVDDLLEGMKTKYPHLAFSKHSIMNGRGKTLLSHLKCEVNKEFVVIISFSPCVLNEISPNSSSTPAPNSGSTPTSPGALMGRSRSNRRTSSRSKRPAKKKKDDMVTKAKQAAEEASKIEQDELNARTIAAMEFAKDREVSRLLGIQISDSLDQVTVFGLNDEDYSGSSKFLVFQKITQHAREAMQHYICHFPETTLPTFFSWIASYSNLYQTPCATCKKVIAKDSDDMLFLPPTMRAYVGASVSTRAFHPQCLPE